MRFARQISAILQPRGRTSNGACVHDNRRGLKGSHPTPLGLEVQQLEGVCEVGPGSGASDDNGCCIIRPSSLDHKCAVLRKRKEKTTPFSVKLLRSQVLA